MYYLHREGLNLGKHLCPLLPVTISLDAQIGTPYPRSAGFDTDCWRYALEAIMYDDISYVFMNKDSPWTLSMMCISKYVTCLWDYALYDDCPKRSLVERAVWTRSQLD